MSLPTVDFPTMPGWEHYTKKPIVRVSALLDFIRCPRRYFYRYGCGLVTPDVKIALSFGEAVHAGLGALLENQTDLPGALTNFEKVWTDELEALGDTKRNRTRAIAMFQAWQQTHVPGRSIYVPEKPPAALGGIYTAEDQSPFELPFVLDLGLPVLLAGRMDGLARHRDTKQLWTLEFKTASSVTSYFLDGFNFNRQILFYQIAANAWGLDVKGTFVEVLEVKAALKTKETPVPTILTKPLEFRKHHLDEGTDLIRRKLSELYEFEKRMNFPKDFGCNPYDTFGSPGFNCDFERLCLPEDWTIYKDTYRKREENVFVVDQ